MHVRDVKSYETGRFWRGQRYGIAGCRLSSRMASPSRNAALDEADSGRPKEWAMRAWLGSASQPALERLHKFDELTALGLGHPRIAVVMARVRITVAGVRAE